MAHVEKHSEPAALVLEELVVELCAIASQYQHTQHQLDAMTLIKLERAAPHETACRRALPSAMMEGASLHGGLISTPEIKQPGTDHIEIKAHLPGVGIPSSQLSAVQRTEGARLRQHSR